MKNINDNFKTLTKKIKQQNAKITLIDSDTSLNFKEAKYGFEGQLFKTIMKQLVITTPILNSLKGKSLNFKYGLYINNQFEYLDLGEFYIKDDPEDDKGKEQTEITAYDNLVHFMKTFKQSEMNLTYPCTMGVFVQRMCEVCNVGLYSTDFFFSDLIINEDYFTTQEITYRDVLEKVAQATLTTIIIKDNKLYLAPISSNPVETLDRSYLSKLVITDKFGPVNALVLGRGDVEDNIEAKDDTSIAQNGRCELRFDENEFIQYQREEVINSMFEKIKGLTYYAFEASDIGVMWLDPADCIALKDNETDIYNSYYLDADITINTGIKSTTQSSIPDETETEYKVTTEEEKKYLKVERLAKKNEGLIQDLIQETSEYNEKFVEIEASLDGISQTVENIEEFSRETTEIDEILLENTIEGKNLILNLKIYGNTDIWKYLVPSENLTPSESLVPLGDSIVIVCDNQSRSNKTENAKEFEISVSEPLRNIGDICDELDITNNKATIIRRIGVNESGELYVLSVEQKEELDDVFLETFDENTYLYVKEYGNLKYYSKYIIDSDYVELFATQDDLENAVVDLNSSITQTAEEINLEVSKKVGDDEIISKINQSAEEVSIQANKIDFKGYEIVLTDYGSTETGDAIFRIYNTLDENQRMYLTSNQLFMNDSENNMQLDLNPQASHWSDSNGNGVDILAQGELYVSNNYYAVFYATADEQFAENLKYVNISQFSLEEYKKNIEKNTDNAINIIQNTEVYNFNYIQENDDDDKHIGFIIGDNYNTSKEILSKDKTGIDFSKVSSLVWKAIQEQQALIENLQKEVEELKNGKN